MLYSLNSSRQFATGLSARILKRVIPVTSPSVLVSKPCSLPVPPAYSAPPGYHDQRSALYHLIRLGEMLPDFSTRTLSRVVPVTLPDAPVLNTGCCLCLQLAQLRLVVLSYCFTACHYFILVIYMLLFNTCISPDNCFVIT